MPRRSVGYTVAIGALALAVGLVAFAFTVQFMRSGVLWDFTYTFYRSGHYLLRGENVYLSDYTQPVDGLQYPPLPLIWSLYFVAPFSVLPIDAAEALFLCFSLAICILIAYFCGRCARLPVKSSLPLLLTAPWLTFGLLAGQLTPLVLLGVMLSYVGLRRSSPQAIAVGLWLTAVKPSLTTLVILATLLFVVRQKILTRTMLYLAALVALSTLGQPSWLIDLARLSLDRVANSRTEFSVLLLPGWPWSQFAVLALTTIWLAFHLYRMPAGKPTLWLWGVLVSASLIAALHTYTYDWMLLMMPLAWLLRDRRAIALVVLFYVYPLVYAFLPEPWPSGLPTPAAIPAVVLLAILAWPFLRRATQPMIAAQAARVPPG